MKALNKNEIYSFEGCTKKQLKEVLNWLKENDICWDIRAIKYFKRNIKNYNLKFISEIIGFGWCHEEKTALIKDLFNDVAAEGREGPLRKFFEQKAKENKEKGLITKDISFLIHEGFISPMRKLDKIFYEPNDLTQRLNFYKQKVEETEKAIQEQNKPKVGDWVKNDCNHIMKYYEWMVFSTNWKKIKNPELIKLLEDESKN